MWDLIEHINQNHPGLPEAIHLNPSNSDSTSRSDITKPSSDWSLSQSLQGSRAFVPTKASRTSNSTHNFQSICPTKASRTSNSTHNFYRASRAFVQPRLPGLVTQPTKGFQSICPTKASRTSNSTQVVTGLPEHLSNQGFQD
jgi:hypothetical protein